MTSKELTMPAVEDSSFLIQARTFLVVWLGQVVSQLGSSMTGFALGVWVYQETGSATGFALTLLFNMLPKAVLAPVAGVIADRYDRRRIMIWADTGAGVATVLTAILFLSGQLEVWHIYLLTAINAGFSAMQGPAFGAAVTQLVRKEQLGRANGLMQLGQGIAQIAAPLLAGLLVVSVGLWGVLLADMATFFFAVATLILVRFPAYRRTDDGTGEGQNESWRKQIWRGFCYLWTRPGLMGLVLLFAIVNFFIGVAEAVLTPLILSFASPDTLGVILTVGGLGLLVGSLVMSSWGGGKRKVLAIFGADALLGVAVIAAGLTISIPVVTGAMFVAFFCVPIVIAGSQAVLQAKVAPAVQGRVLALNMMLNTAAFAAAFLLSGPLADRLFEPIMSSNGLLAGTAGQLIGVGPGRGMGLMFVIMGLLAVAAAVSAFAYPRIRNVETELPDMLPE